MACSSPARGALNKPKLDIRGRGATPTAIVDVDTDPRRRCP